MHRLSVPGLSRGAWEQAGVWEGGAPCVQNCTSLASLCSLHPCLRFSLSPLTWVLSPKFLLPPKPPGLATYSSKQAEARLSPSRTGLRVTQRPRRQTFQVQVFCRLLTQCGCFSPNRQLWLHRSFTPKLVIFFSPALSSGALTHAPGQMGEVVAGCLISGHQPLECSL